MIIIRPIETNDFSAYQKMAEEASLGLTSLPKNPKLLLERITLSEKSLAHPPSEIMLFVFVAEDTSTKDLIGTTSISPFLNKKTPKFYYREEKISPPFRAPHIPESLPILRAVADTSPGTEIGGLFLHHAYRGRGIGKLLFYSRFLFMGIIPECISDPLFAELRGFIDPQGHSPFWHYVGRHFFHVSLDEALTMRIEHPEILPAIVPKMPFYTPLLHPEAQNAIGGIFPNTRPAWRMLEREGFVPSGEVDIIDGGPRYVASRSTLRVEHEKKKGRLTKISLDHKGSSFGIVSNASSQFRATMAHFQLEEQGEITLDRETADNLRLREGDGLWYFLIKV